MKNWPYDFPHPADVIAEDVARNRNLSMSDRLEKMFGIYEFGREMAGLQLTNEHQILKAQSHLLWRTAMERVFAKHGK